MSWSYSCPHCKGILNRNETIMLQGTCGSDEIVIGLNRAAAEFAEASIDAWERILGFIEAHR